VSKLQLIIGNKNYSSWSMRPWLFGKFSIADAMYAPVVMRFVTYDVTLVGVAQDYADAVRGHRAVSEWVRASKTETEVVTRTDAVTNAGSE